ncbi:hypothetical protein ACVWWK_002259 [Bradyrhizobium sp. LB9.1b]
MGRKVDAQAENARRAVMSAETALRERKPKAAVQALQSVDTASPGYARKLMMDACLAIPDWSGLITLLHTPGTVEESVTLVSALMETWDLVGAQSRLDAATEIDDGTRAGLQARIDAKALMRPK